MAALDRLFGRAFGRPIRRLPPGRLAIPALAAGLAIVGGAVVLQPSPGPRQDGGQAAGVGAVPPSGAPGPVTVGATPEPSPGVATPTPRADFWLELSGGGGTGPAYRSLADLGERSEAVVVGSFTGELEPGREARDEGAEAAGMPREQASVFFANLPFRIDEVLGGSVPEQYRTTVKLEYQVDPGRQEALAEVVPTDARVVLFIGSKYLRRAGIQAVYYAVGVGKGTFREVDGRVVSLALPDDPEIGRLEGMPFERFVDLVRRVPILDLMPEG